MCFKKRRKEIDAKFESIEKSISDLKDFVANHELIKLQENSRKLQEQSDLLKNINIKVRNASYFVDENGIPRLKISYFIPDIVIDIDEDYNLGVNQMFRAINKLDLVSTKDWNLIYNQLTKIDKDREKHLASLNKKGK